MKKSIWIWMLAICLFRLTGCQTAPEETLEEKEIPAKQTEQLEEEKNPFDLSEIEKSGK